MIPQYTVLDGYNEIIRLNKISSEKPITAANGKEKKLKKKFKSNLSFRQTNSFNFDPNDNSVSFDIVALSNETLYKDNDEINVDVNLLLTLDSKYQEAKCIINKGEDQGPFILKCKINNIQIDKINNKECIGLEIKESDILINVPKDRKLCNPKKVDKLISLGEIEEAQAKINIPEFNATSIDTTDSLSSGIFIIKGQPLNDNFKNVIFNITLISGETATCKLIETNKDNEAKIECELDGVIEKSKIMIPKKMITNGNKEIFKLNEIATQREVSCTNGKLKKMKKKLDNKISFRQINHFNPSGTKITFILSTFIIDNMKEGEEIEIDVNLNKGNNEFLHKIAKCKLKKAVTGASKERQIPSNFECTIENIENTENIIGLELISSDDISGIPNDLNMTDPANIDDLIKSGKILDYSLDENKNNLPPVFNISSLNSLGCKATGVFKLKGTIDKPIKHHRLNIPLSYPPVDLKCDIPDAKEGEVEVICKTKNSFSPSKMIIEQTTFSKNNSEVISILPTSSDNEISCEDFNSVYSKKMIKKFKAPFSFIQTQKFIKDNGKIFFSLFGFRTDNWEQEKKNKIKIKVKPIKSSTLRNLEELPSIETDCTAKKDITDDNKPIEFSCEFNENDANGLIIYDSDEVSGIPENVMLANPAEVDLLINNKTLIDCSSKTYSLADYSGGDLCSDNCDIGTIYIENGTIEGNIRDESIFNLSISPESYGDCQISVKDKKIECYNKEEIEDSKILIPETVIRDKENNTDLFKLKGVISKTDDINCAINNNWFSTSNSTTFTEDYKYNRNKNSSGLNGGIIAGIIIAFLIALIAIIAIIVLINSGKCSKNQNKIDDNIIQNSQNIVNSTVKL